MSTSEYAILHILHVGGALVLMAFTFYAFAAAPETRKRTMVWTGGASLVVLLAGVRMWQAIYHFAPAGWIIVKILCWLGLSVLAGIAYRRRDKVRVLSWIALVLAIVAVAMVYTRPF